jgi:hypothetical protein
VLFAFVGAAPERELRPREGLEVAWHPLERLDELPLVGDVAQILPRLWDTSQPVFATEAYDGRDRRLSIHFEEDGDVAVAARAAGV